ncbi:PE-PGRS family protein [Methylobacterium sp. 4-46]|nr:PE-PGRS family protein [Methylobacterium sp. 4-46]
MVAGHTAPDPAQNPGRAPNARMKSAGRPRARCKGRGRRLQRRQHPRRSAPERLRGPQRVDAIIQHPLWSMRSCGPGLDGSGAQAGACTAFRWPAGRGGSGGSAPTLRGALPRLRGNAGIGGWWTAERQQHAVDVLVKGAALGAGREGPGGALVGRGGPRRPDLGEPALGGVRDRAVAVSGPSGSDLRQHRLRRAALARPAQAAHDRAPGAREAQLRQDPARGHDRGFEVRAGGGLQRAHGRRPIHRPNRRGDGGAEGWPWGRAGAGRDRWRRAMVWCAPWCSRSRARSTSAATLA